MAIKFLFFLICLELTALTYSGVTLDKIEDEIELEEDSIIQARVVGDQLEVLRDILEETLRIPIEEELEVQKLFLERETTEHHVLSTFLHIRTTAFSAHPWDSLQLYFSELFSSTEDFILEDILASKVQFSKKLGTQVDHLRILLDYDFKQPEEPEDIYLNLFVPFFWQISDFPWLYSSGPTVFLLCITCWLILPLL